MRTVSGRPPRLRELALAIVWPSLLVGAVVAVGLFDAATLAAAVVPAGQEPVEAFLGGAVAGVALGVLVGALVLLFCICEVADARRPARQALVLGRVAEATRVLSFMLKGGLLTGLVVMTLALFAMQSGLDSVAIFAAALVVVPATRLVLLRTQRQTRLIAARTRRWARRLCLRCNYDITGLARCPECGTDVQQGAC